MNIQVKKKILWALLFSVGFTVYLLQRVDWTHFTLISGRLDVKYLIAAYAIFLFGNLIRTFRFCRLDHLDKNLTHWWYIGVFYNFITATLPGGSGEAATAYVLKRFSKFNLLGALRILFISRLMDISALSALFFLASIWISSDTPYRETATWLTGLLFLLTAIALIPASERFILRLLQKMPGDVAVINKICERLTELIEIAKERQSVGFYAGTLIPSVLSMIGGIIALYMLLRSFGVEFTLVQSVYCYGVYAIFQVVPIQGIAGLGTQAAWWTLALNASGYKSPDAIALGFILYGIFYCFIAVMGLVSLPFWLKGKEKR